jgi:putative ABC transport system permease protein
MGLVISEALIISFLGGLMGLGMGHGLTAVGSLLIKAETGVGFTASYVSLADWLVLPGVLLLGLMAGLVPGLQAYRLGILQNLSPLS